MRARFRHQTYRVLHEMPALLGLIVSWMALSGVLLVLSMWMPVLTRGGIFSDFGAGGRFVFGAIFLGLFVVAARWPVRGAGAASLFFAGTRIYDAWFHPPFAALGGVFWTLAIFWIVISEFRGMASVNASKEAARARTITQAL